MADRTSSVEAFVLCALGSALRRACHGGLQSLLPQAVQVPELTLYVNVAKCKIDDLGRRRDIGHKKRK